MNDNKLTKSDMYGVIWRSFNFAGNYNFERMMAVGMTDMLIPVIRKLYDTKEEVVQALKRHLVFYNCHPYLGGAMITGIMVAMEEKKGKWRTNRGFYHQWSENGNDGTVCWCGRFFFFWGEQFTQYFYLYLQPLLLRVICLVSLLHFYFFYRFSNSKSYSVC